MNTERLDYLLLQYVQRSSTREELDELFSFIAAEKKREELQAFMDSRLANQIPHIQAKEIDWDFMFNRIVQRPSTGQSQDPNSPHAAETLAISSARVVTYHSEYLKTRRIFWRSKTIAAAAALVLLLAGSVIFWRFNRSTITDNTHQTLVHANPPATKDIAPGHNGAILTLADGKQIVLDSAHNGALSSQGSIKIMKQGGTVAYTGPEGSDNITPGSGSTQEPATPAINVMSTPRGRQYQLVLADGTKVWLNSASSIRFPTAFTGDRRSVEITGEVYFEIARDEKRPFDVTTKDLDIQVMGTHFNVNNYSDERVARVTLLEGAVKIAGAKKEGQQTGQTGQKKGQADGQAEHILQPGQQAILDHASGRTKVISDVNTDNVMAWKNGWFSFDKADLTEVMRQLARWYDVEIVFADNVPQEHFSGEIDCTLSLAQVLKILEKTHVHFRIEENRRIMILPG